jgi:L-aspartate oxidase
VPDAWTPRAIVVGSGLAGLTSAERLAAAGWQVEVVSPGTPGHDGASHRVHALAPWVLLTAPFAPGDGPRRFLADLEERAGGLARPGLAEVLADDAHDVALALLAKLDLEPLGREPVLLAGDGWPRGLRCRPRTHRPLLEPLVGSCRGVGVRFRPATVATGLLLADGRVAGVAARGERNGSPLELRGDAVVLATGGVGGVFPRATVPRWCCGSGVALAAAAGVLLHRPDLVQRLPVAARRPWPFLGTAASLGGELSVDGHQRANCADLAGLSALLAAELRAGHSVSLRPGRGWDEIPPVLQRLALAGPGREVPLTLAAHHGTGGVAIDAWGRTSLPGLYACGEAAGGVQGARRTMGTGLVEACLFGGRVAAAADRDVRRLGPAAAPDGVREVRPIGRPEQLAGRLDEVLADLLLGAGPEDLAGALTELDGWAEQPALGGIGASWRTALRRSAAVEVLRASGRGP